MNESTLLYAGISSDLALQIALKIEEHTWAEHLAENRWVGPKRRKAGLFGCDMSQSKPESKPPLSLF